MKCPKCNFEVAENAKFCPECGEKIFESTSKDSFEIANEKSNEKNSTTEANSKKSISKKVKISIIIGVTSVLLIAIALFLILVVFKHEHVWIYEITKEPTYTENGVEYRSCEGCGTVEYYGTVPRLSISDMIDSISDAESCYQAVQVFNSLPENEQENYSWSLITAMKLYSSDSRIRDILMELKAEEESNIFHNRLKNKLLNINSYTVNNQTTVVFYDETTDNYYLYIKIDYSAQNKAGGYTRYENNAAYYVWKNNYWSTLPYSSDEDIELREKIYTWQFDEYDRYHFKYNAN